ncbi:anhydro-N-acetylmuramic acid kinase [Romeria aff. gracilis LEGE 07310]|uniref:Anhydro-N-acetylmuramic acid kinase n=1 Tax=Vasconcelosia minhoensis LEGE 07310 TaxID=915328 RepID=A0A8J7AL53_9CYAN|nr:anhydro-N-acetylmuramic acid kinase [Romeria gracilis]MBE9076141.1 anhydro-N-acetylmuramic acid kinase [Romeria aff. gracilis LEGE 07310]
MKAIGLISGTSVDGIDAALVEISGAGYQIAVELLKATTYPYPAGLRSRLLAVCADQPLTMAELATLDDAVATQFAQAAMALNADLATVTLIGSHGQTVFHRPPQAGPQTDSQSGAEGLGYSLQLGRGELIAQLTGCPTVSNFRIADLALGGQGAPLVPPVDACLLSHPEYDRAMQNIGGIGNVTYLPAWAESDRAAAPQGVKGWDTGPGNALLDWAVEHLSAGQLTYDRDGAWAAQGVFSQSLVEAWLAHPFYSQLPPKSTGRELFGASYGRQCWAQAQAQELSPADFLATLTELTAVSIELSYRQFLPQFPQEVLIGGGGSQNAYLMQRLQQRLRPATVLTTDQAGISSSFKEAIAFAVLGYWRWHQVPGNLPSVTGARDLTLLGQIARV